MVLSIIRSTASSINKGITKAQSKISGTSVQDLNAQQRERERKAGGRSAYVQQQREKEAERQRDLDRDDRNRRPPAPTPPPAPSEPPEPKAAPSLPPTPISDAAAIEVRSTAPSVLGGGPKSSGGLQPPAPTNVNTGGPITQARRAGTQAPVAPARNTGSVLAGIHTSSTGLDQSADRRRRTVLGTL